MKKIAVIGGGWYGCHIARFLALAGYDVTLFESSDDIFKGISGKFGIRLHVGPHYPRSEKTRKSCREGYAEFIKTYPDLVVEHAYSIYGLGTLDANGEPPKIDLKTFKEVGKEIKNSREIDPKKWGYNNLQSAFDVEEPSILVGNLLREKFKTYLQKTGVKIVCNCKIQKLIRWKDTKTLVIGDNCFGVFDYAVNTSSYQALLPPPEASLPFKLDIVYQPCLALVYEDRLSKVMSLPPFSFIVMDGWFPCIMPYIEDKEDRAATGSIYRKYIVTHGKYTIMGSYKKAEDASACLVQIDEKFITKHIQPRCEAEMERFWPLFGACMPASTERRFKCVGWKSDVLAKIKTNREFRSAVTFAKDGVAYIIPGKVSNIFDAGRETLSLIEKRNVLQQGAYQYVKRGALDDAVSEITEAVDPKIRNTCNLQTYAEITGHPDAEKKATPSESKQNSPSKSNPPIQWLSRKDVAQISEMKPSDLVSFFQSPSKTPCQTPSRTPKNSSTVDVNSYKIRASL
jgi:hypothetical protein